MGTVSCRDVTQAMTDQGPMPTKHMADAIRVLAMDAVEAAKSGHPGMPMGMADAATVLFTRHLKFDPSQPDWPDRDRFVLSAGHGSMLLYALLHLTGYQDMTMDELRRFRQLGSRTAGHPEYGHAGGIETTTGPLGQGLGNAVGMALAERMLNARYGDALVDHMTYVIAGDGCLMEGISHEAASLAGHLKLNRLVVLFDDNGISIDGSTDLSVSDDTLGRFRAYGWNVDTVADGHDMAAIDTALTAARSSDRPTLIAVRTQIGYGAPNKAGTAASHGAPLGAEEIAAARSAYGWSEGPFELPGDIAEAWREAGRRGGGSRSDWEKRLADAPDGADFQRDIAGDLPAGWDQALNKLIASHVADKPKLATRVASQKALEALLPSIPALVGGSADLTGSNNTRIKDMSVVSGTDFSGRYIHWGVREHGMAAAMNGMALHGGLIPYGGTFLVFTDYCRPSIRLAALMKQRVVYVMTHDSIGLGEDGPTHQPVEHLAALRAIPGLSVMRPADAVETAECWALAVSRKHGPTVLALTRQGLPTMRESLGENRSAKGGYVLAEANGPRAATLIATGSEVEIAMAARALLEQGGIATAVVSMPCFELFAETDAAYQRSVLGESGIRVGVEAAIALGWERWIGPDGLFVGMGGFGASAPYGDLYEHFGITAAGIADAVRAKLG